MRLKSASGKEISAAPVFAGAVLFLLVAPLVSEPKKKRMEENRENKERQNFSADKNSDSPNHNALPDCPQTTENERGRDETTDDCAFGKPEETPVFSSSGTKAQESGEPKKKEGFFRRLKDRAAHWKNALFSALGERSAEIKHAKVKRIVALVLLGVVLALFVTFYFTVGKAIARFVNDPESFREWINGFDEKSVVIFIALRVVQTVTKLIPGEALEIAAGCAFGVWWGLLWCLVGTLIGSVIIIWLGKKYGMKLIGLFISPERIHSIGFLQNKKRFNVTFFILYFIPGMPKDMFTWLVCLTDENPFKFLFLTTLARIPSALISVWCGHEFVKENYLLSVVIFVVTIVLGLGGSILYKLLSGKNKKTSEQETGNGEKAPVVREKETGENSSDET